MFIVLQRDKEATVKSFFGKTKFDLWSECVDQSQWDKETRKWGAAYMKFPCREEGKPNMTESVSQYYDYYYQTVRRLEEDIPGRFRTFGSPAFFSDMEGQEDVLNWLGFDNPFTASEWQRTDCYFNCRPGLDYRQSSQKRVDMEEEEKKIKKEEEGRGGEIKEEGNEGASMAQ